MRIALDTNLLAYAAGVVRIAGDAPKVAAAIDLIEQLGRGCEMVIPAQALGELYNVLTRIAGKSRGDAKVLVDAFRAAYTIVETSEAVLVAALELASAHQLSIWDAIILDAAATAGCSMLISEDMQNGFTWRGVVVVDPFSARSDPRLAAALALSQERDLPPI